MIRHYNFIRKKKKKTEQKENAILLKLSFSFCLNLYYHLSKKVNQRNKLKAKLRGTTYFGNEKNEQKM